MATEDQKIVLDEKTTQIGFMMEAAMAQQKAAKALQNAAEVNQQLAQTTLAQLQYHNKTLVPAVVEGFKGTVREVLLDGMAGVRSETGFAISGLRGLYSRAQFRLAWISGGCVVLSLLMGIGVSSLFTPSAEEIAELRATVDELVGKGGHADLKMCPVPHKPDRLCIRVDAKAGTYTKDDVDYMIVYGY